MMDKGDLGLDLQPGYVGNTLHSIILCCFLCENILLGK